MVSSWTCIPLTVYPGCPIPSPTAKLPRFWPRVVQFQTYNDTALCTSVVWVMPPVTIVHAGPIIRGWRVQSSLKPHGNILGKPDMLITADTNGFPSP